MIRSLPLTGLILGLGIASVQAGPCTSEILRIEKAINEPNSPYIPTAPQSVGAQTDVQPTPSAVARAERQADSNYRAVLDRARALDNQNNSECEEVVRELKDLVGMQ
jgi:hypothetical protein